MPSGDRVRGEVKQQVQPDVQPAAMSTIKGSFQLIVQLTVDENGRVTDASLASPGPSKYFAGKALDAARRWQFKPAKAAGRAVPSTWLLTYRFQQSGIDVTPEETAP